MVATTPNTLGMLQSLQALIIANSGTTFAALSASDATRYGVSRAVLIGAPKDFRDGYLPQLHLEPLADQIAVTHAQGRVEDSISVRLRAFVDFSDWWAAEQNILNIRDLLVPLLATHLRAGATAGGNLAALALAPGEIAGEFDTVEVAGVWYRAWACVVTLEQVYVPAGGFIS